MAGRARITLGIAVGIAVLAMMAREHVLLQLLLAIFAVFLILWGRAERRMEAFIGGLRGGSYALKVLNQLDLIISPRDQEYDKYIKAIIIGYDDDLKASLRTLFITRNSSRISANHLSRFIADGFMEFPKDGPGSIKEELRVIVRRTLDELP